MPSTPSSAAQERLRAEKNIWLASTRPDQRPHLVPIWFVWVQERVFLCTGPNSVKARNIAQNPAVSLALEDGNHPLIFSGTARIVSDPWPAEVVQEFERKYEWKIEQDSEYTLLLEISPQHWLSW